MAQRYALCGVGAAGTAFAVTVQLESAVSDHSRIGARVSILPSTWTGFNVFRPFDHTPRFLYVFKNSRQMSSVALRSRFILIMNCEEPNN